MSQSRPSRRLLLQRLLTLALPLGVLGCGRQSSGAPALKAGVFEPPRSAPDFTLQGTDGEELRLSRYRGKVVLLAFGYSSCPSICPTTLATFARACQQLGSSARDVQVVYVTVDPERDVPETLKGFLARFDPTFVGGTGTPEQLAAMRQGFGVSAQKLPFGNTYAYSHSSSAYLIDRAGLIRAMMPYGHSADDYVHDLRILMQS